MALIPLSKSDPTDLHPDAFDVRGWEVRTEADDHKVGSVDDVLMDGGGTPHLLDVNLGTFSRHVLLPLSQSWADPANRVVWIEGLGRDDLKTMPSYDHRPDSLTPEFEGKLVDDYAALAAGAHQRATRPPSDRLSRLDKGKDFKISKGSSDPRGWKVVGGDGAKLGKVTELIVDRERMQICYLDVDVDEKKLKLEQVDRHVLVPIERVRLDHTHKSAILDGLFARDLTTYPVFTGLPLAQGVEDAIAACYRGEERTSEGWVDRSAKRFFGSARQRGLAAPESSDPARALETVALPQEGEEVRIRVSGGEVIIEKHPGVTDHG